MTIKCVFHIDVSHYHSDQRREIVKIRLYENLDFWRNSRGLNISESHSVSK